MAVSEHIKKLNYAIYKDSLIFEKKDPPEIHN
jgi:hypothetical protein